MASLWGFENLPTMPRKKDWWETVPEVAGRAVQGVSDWQRQANAREMALKKMAAEEAQNAEENSRARAMQALQERRQTFQEGEAGTRRQIQGEEEAVAPLSGLLKSVPMASQTAEIRSRLEALSGDPRIRSSGMVPEEPFTPAPTFTGEEGGNVAPVPYVQPMSVSQKAESMGPEIQRALASMESGKQGQKMEQIRGRPGSGLTFEQRVFLQNNQGRINSIRDSAKAMGTKMSELVEAKLFQMQDALERGNQAEADAYLRMAREIVRPTELSSPIPGGGTRRPVQRMLPGVPGPSGPTVVETRTTPSGKTIQKMSDGTYREVPGK